MRKLPMLGFLLILGAILAVTGCGGATTSINPTSPTTSTTTTTTPALEPVAVVSVVGPIPPFNPGGPKIEVTLKNNSLYPVISLNANIGIDKPGTDISYDYSFNVTSSTPLPPGNSVSSAKILIGGGFNSDANYPLLIRGEMQDGEAFRYTVQVKISAPAQ